MLRDSIFSIITTIVRLATGLVLFVVLAHAWGPEPFGIFMYPFTIAAILVRVIDYGFLLQVVRDVGKLPARAHDIMSRAFGAKLVLVIPAAAAALVIALRLPSGKHYSLLLALLLSDAIANSFAQFLNIPLRALGRFDEEARISAVANALVFVIVASVVLLGFGPVTAAIALAGSRAGYLVLSWRAYRRLLSAHPRPVLDPPSVRRALKEGLPFGVHATVGTLTMQVDTLMVQHFLGAESVGLYQAGMRILLGALLVGDALNSVYLSAMARASHQAAELNRLGMRMTRHLLTVGMVAFACTVGGGHLVVRLLFGGHYDPLVPLLPFFGLLMFIRYGGVSYGTLLTLADRQMVRVLAVCGVMVLGIALNMVLIPRFGLTGAIVAATASHIILYGVYVVAARRDHGSFLIDWRSGMLLAIACATVALTFVLSTASVPMRLQLGALLVLASVLLGVTRAEWTVLSARIGRSTA